MRKPSIRLAAAAVLMLSGFSAQACEIWRDPDFGFWRGNCDLEKFKVSTSFIANFEHRLILKWPDLQVRDFSYFVSGTSIDIIAEIANVGMGNAAASTLVVDASIGNPLTNMQQGNSVQFTVQVPALTSNSSRSVNVGTMFVPSSPMQDWDLVVFGVIDPMTVAQPVRGLLIESDETNNSRPETCRWYGPNPDTSVGPCN